LVNRRTVHLRLVAPVDGTVQGLKIHTPSAVATADAAVRGHCRLV
jgi:hypothetical protein